MKREIVVITKGQCSPLAHELSSNLESFSKQQIILFKFSLDHNKGSEENFKV